jgi:hypothetical protein
MQLLDGTFDQSDQLTGSPLDGLVQRGSLMRGSNGLTPFKAGFHHAAHVPGAALLVAVLIAQVHFHPRDVIAEPAQGTVHDSPDVSGQRLTPFDIAVGIDLDLHGVLLFVMVRGSMPVDGG